MVWLVDFSIGWVLFLAPNLQGTIAEYRQTWVLDGCKDATGPVTGCTRNDYTLVILRYGFLRMTAYGLGGAICILQDSEHESGLFGFLLSKVRSRDACRTAGGQAGMEASHVSSPRIASCARPSSPNPPCKGRGCRSSWRW